MRISLEASALFAQLRLLRLSSEVERVSGTISAEMANSERAMPAGWGQPGGEAEGGAWGGGSPLCPTQQPLLPGTLDPAL